METKGENTSKVVFQERSAEIVSSGHVFYNPVQEFNRDLSVTVLNVFFKLLSKERQKQKQKTNNENVTDINADFKYVPGERYEDGMRILEALSATGLRSIRYAKEIAGVREILANDLSKQAVESIKANVRHNGVEHLVYPNHSDAMTYMYLSTSPEKRFDVIDLDPYGCPNRFLDGAIQSIAEGGLLLVTATDMAVLAGNAPEACFVKYGSAALRMKSCHEMALRILLYSIESHANRYGKYIEPLLSVSVDFYIRIFVRVYTNQYKCKFSMSKHSFIFQCTGCHTFSLHPLGQTKPNPSKSNPNQVKFGIPTGPPVNTNCEHCAYRHHIGGPIWSAPIHNMEFVEELLDEIQEAPLRDLGTARRLNGVLSVILEELPDVPLYYTLDQLCSVLKLQIMPILKFRSALLFAGYRVSFSHAFKNSIKTDAPPKVLWDILRCWQQQNPVKDSHITDGTPVKAILEKSCEETFNFNELHPSANPCSRRTGLSRFQANPTSHWGPGTRATVMIGDKKLPKSQRNQNKKQRQNMNFAEEANNEDNLNEDEIQCKLIKLQE
ncbi:probable tRNA (guanine(26)-N(2))-dimethyltransferase [Teleopsis dalmanni]|uniref:probable tRNA (guanine(26)-N(2))-dimethyltransferase n=1 Tax=Teleopsis dalmanni TaxID=139649 RepID=UPI0018CCBDFB|nr:probable tRNA (guanine(26)-N(2))-dimethyltransferase [Teleopsis dalmanni]